MEIKNINRNAISSYKTIACPKTSEKKPADSVGVKPNFDTVEIDFSLTFEAALESAKKNMASKLDADANAAKIKQLQGDYAQEACPVSPDSVATAIISD